MKLCWVFGAVLCVCAMKAGSFPTGGDWPVTGGHRPITEGDRPIMDGDRPITGGDRPITGVDRPITGGDRPVTGGGDKKRDAADDRQKSLSDGNENVIPAMEIVRRKRSDDSMRWVRQREESKRDDQPYSKYRGKGKYRYPSVKRDEPYSKHSGLGKYRYLSVKRDQPYSKYKGGGKYRYPSAKKDDPYSNYRGIGKYRYPLSMVQRAKKAGGVDQDEEMLEELTEMASGERGGGVGAGWLEELQQLAPGEGFHDHPSHSQSSEDEELRDEMELKMLVDHLNERYLNELSRDGLEDALGRSIEEEEKNEGDNAGDGIMLQDVSETGMDLDLRRRRKKSHLNRIVSEEYENGDDGGFGDWNERKRKRQTEENIYLYGMPSGEEDRERQLLEEGRLTMLEESPKQAKATRDVMTKRYLLPPHVKSSLEAIGRSRRQRKKNAKREANDFMTRTIENRWDNIDGSKKKKRNVWFAEVRDGNGNVVTRRRLAKRSQRSAAEEAAEKSNIQRITGPAVRKELEMIFNTSSELRKSNDNASTDHVNPPPHDLSEESEHIERSNSDHGQVQKTNINAVVGEDNDRMDDDLVELNSREDGAGGTY